MQYLLVPAFAPIFIYTLSHWCLIAKVCEARKKIIWATIAYLLLGVYAISLLGQYTLINVYLVVLIALAIIDHVTGYLPDSFTLALLASGILFNIGGYLHITPPQLSEPIASIVGAIAGYGFFWIANQIAIALKGVDGLGMGDAKLLAAMGAWFGPLYLVYVVAIASSTSLIIPLLKWLRGQGDASATAPFGPYLVIGAIGAFLV